MSSALEGLFATTTPGLEQVLAAEVRALGHSPQSERGGVGWTAPPGGHAEANLWLRTANRVFLRLQTVETKRGAGWVRAFNRSLLGRVWARDVPVRLEVHAGGTEQGAIARAVRETLQLGPEPESQVPGLSLQLRVEEGSAQLSVDTSGDLLYRRGYRQEVSRAPLRETLAAGLLALAEQQPGAPFLDALCGSGTLAIEAAWRARGRAPGSLRSFAFQKWPGADSRGWEARLAQARAAEKPRAPRGIFASNLNAGSLGTARRNARRAGVLEDLVLSRADVAALERPPEGGAGLWLSNLPYGARVGKADELRGLYQKVAETWKRALPDWRAAFLVKNASLLEEAMGCPPSGRYPLLNGGIPCELLVWS